MDINIVQAYLKFNKQLIIFISGLPGSGKSIHAKELVSDLNNNNLKVKLLYIRDYYKEQKEENTETENTETENTETVVNTDTESTTYQKNRSMPNKVKLSDGTFATNKYSHSFINLNKLNEDIGKYKAKGVVISGFPLPDKLIEHKIDFHFNLSINQTIYMNNQLKGNKTSLNEQSILLKFKEVIQPYYNDIMKDLKVKYINVKKYETKEAVYDDIWKLLMSFIQSSLKKDDQ